MSLFWTISKKIHAYKYLAPGTVLMNYHCRHKYIDANTSAIVDIIIACAPNHAYLSSIISFIPAQSFFWKIEFFFKNWSL